MAGRPLAQKHERGGRSATLPFLVPLRQTLMTLSDHLQAPFTSEELPAPGRGRGGRGTAGRGVGRRSDDPVTALAVARVRQAHPSQRLLILTGLTVSEYAKQVEPPVTRARLADVFAQAEAFGRLSAEWAARLGRVAGVPADAVLRLFSIAEPSRPGRPRTRQLVDPRGGPRGASAGGRRSAARGGSADVAHATARRSA